MWFQGSWVRIPSPTLSFFFAKCLILGHLGLLEETWLICLPLIRWLPVGIAITRAQNTLCWALHGIARQKSHWSSIEKTTAIRASGCVRWRCSRNRYRLTARWSLVFLILGQRPTRHENERRIKKPAIKRPQAFVESIFSQRTLSHHSWCMVPSNRRKQEP